jgi:hypothetical protein
MRRDVLTALILFCLMASLHGCTVSRTYLIEVKYIGEKDSPRSSLMVGVCPFDDLRKEAEPGEIGVRYSRGKQVDFLNAEAMSVSQSVTQAVKDYFFERGYKVTDYTHWNKGPRGLSGVPKAMSLVVGGNIESFLVEAHSGIATTETTYRMKLVAFIGQVAQKKVVIRTVESAPKTKAMGFDILEVRDKLNTTLTEMIRNLFKDT